MSACGLKDCGGLGARAGAARRVTVVALRRLNRGGGEQPVQCSPFPVAPRLTMRENRISRTFRARWCAAPFPLCPAEPAHVLRTFQGLRPRRRRGPDRVPAGVIDWAPPPGPAFL